MRPFFQYFLIVLMLMMVHATWAQPPLSKRLQKQKEAFEQQIAFEEKYDSLVTAADRAFKANDFLLARMTYEEAIPYDPEQEQWLVSKVNDLDILMAKNAAREVDSILVKLEPRKAVDLGETRETIGLEQRKMEAPLPLPEREDTLASNEAPTKTVDEVNDTPEVADKSPKVNTPSEKKTPPVQTPSKKDAPVKVKEDFSGFEDGITEETFTLTNHEVIRIVVKEGIDVKIFKKVKHNWGGVFYFLDDVGTSERYWSDEVNRYRDKYAKAED